MGGVKLGARNGVSLPFTTRAPSLPLSLLSQSPVLQQQGTGDGKPSLHFLSGKQLDIKSSLASALGREFQIQSFMGTCSKYQIDALQYV